MDQIAIVCKRWHSKNYLFTYTAYWCNGFGICKTSKYLWKNLTCIIRPDVVGPHTVHTYIHILSTNDLIRKGRSHYIQYRLVWESNVRRCETWDLSVMFQRALGIPSHHFLTHMRLELLMKIYNRKWRVLIGTITNQVQATNAGI